jgi:hypothetical protein
MGDIFASTSIEPDAAKTSPSKSNVEVVSASRTMFQSFTSTVIVVGILFVIGAWYVIVGLVSLLAIVFVVLYRSRRAKRVGLEVQPVVNGRLSPSQLAVAQRRGFLSLAQEKSLRVVELSSFRSNHEWLADQMQLETSETLVVDGFLLASKANSQMQPALESGSRVVYFCTGDRVLGQLPNIELDQWWDGLLEIGGAARCRLRVSFSGSHTVSRIEAIASPDAT